MTPEEAIEGLRHYTDNEFYTDRFQDVCRTAIKALEKQIPKKPMHYIFDNSRYPKCPCCGDNWNMDEYGSGMVHCWECGQLIDWSEEE